MLNIIKKEIRELLTPASIASMVVVAVIFALVGQMVGSPMNEITEKPSIGVVNQDEGLFSQTAISVISENAEVLYLGEDRDDGWEKVQEKGIALLVIHEDFSSSILEGRPARIEVNWLLKGTGLMDNISSVAVTGLIQMINTSISEELISGGIEIPPEVALSPVGLSETVFLKDKVIPGVSPEALSGLLISQSVTIPIVIMMMVIMAGSTVISSMGLEKESKTLETLLSLPIRRRDIVIGKLAGSAAVGLIMAVIYMLGFNYYMESLTVSSSIDLGALGLSLGMGDYLLVGLSILLSLFAGLALCLLIGTFARDYKNAQTLIFPVTILAMVPMFLVMFKDFGTLSLLLQVILFIIPFSHPMMAMRALMFDNYVLVIGGIAYLAVFSIAITLVLTKIFSSDRLLVGWSWPKRGAKT